MNPEAQPQGDEPITPEEAALIAQNEEQPEVAGVPDDENALHTEGMGDDPEEEIRQTGMLH